MPRPLRRGTLRPIRTSKRCASGRGTATWAWASFSPSCCSSALPIVAEPVAIIPVQVILLGFGQPVDGQRRAVALGTGFERELQVVLEVAVVGQQGFPADIR